MKSVVRYCAAIMAVLCISTVQAQEVRPGVDLFETPFDFGFDDLSGLTFPDLECDKCKQIEAEIAEKQAKISEIKAELADIETALDQVEISRALAKDAKAEAEAELEEMRDPQNYVESEGRRYDSSDHAAMQRRSANLWDAYKAGDMTAQEYSDEVGKPFDDPDVAKELEKLKKEIEEELEDEIDGHDDVLGELDDFEKELNASASALTDELKDCLDKLEKLVKDRDDCYKRCTQEKVNVPEDYGVGQIPRGFFGGIFDFFDGLFGGPPLILPDADTIVERLDPPEPGGTGEVPIELVALQLQSVEPIVVDLGPIQILPEPKCQLCEPLAKEIKAKEAEVAKQEAEIAQLKAEIAAHDTAIATAEDLLDTTKNNLDRLQNPPDFVESEGRRYDSSDHAAMQVRNARLWGEYKGGRLSASQLEAEWEKPFDDPGVAKELEKIKEDMEQELEDIVDDLEDTLDDLKDDKKDLEEELDALVKKTEECRKKLAAMRADYDECQKKCALSDLEPLDTLLEDFTELIKPQSDGDHLTVSNIGSSGEDGVSVDLGEEPGFLCDTLGLFCPNEPVLDLDTLAQDPGDVDLFLDGPGTLDFPLDIRGFDDIGLATDCLRTGRGCDDLIVGDPPGDVLDGLGVGDPLNLDGGDFDIRVRGRGGDDLLLGSPDDDLIGIGTRDGDGPDPIPAGFFGPGSEPFDPDGIDLLYFGTTDRTVGLEWPDATPPPDPVVPPPVTARGPQLPEIVRLAVERILRDNPPGPCEVLTFRFVVVKVNGTPVSARIFVTRRFDTSKCPPVEIVPDPEVLVDPPEFLDRTNTLEPIDPIDDPIEDLCEDLSRCDDGDECTEDDCDPETGACSNTPIDGCGEEDEVVECHNDLGHFSKRNCEAVCSNGDCNPRYDSCYYCTPKDLPPPPEECDSPTKTESACRNSCDGTCTKSYTRGDGVKCFECVLEERTTCSGDSVESCGDCPSNTECNALNDDCFSCDPIIIEDEGPSCPSGTTTDKSSCESACGPQGGVCLDENEDGCFECLVVNCPGGTFKDTCPSDCSSGCDEVGSQFGVSCYQCKQSCEDVCAGMGLQVGGANEILSALQGHECFRTEIARGSSGDCECFNVIPSTEKLVCDTQFGPVTCGTEERFTVDENTTAIVTCSQEAWDPSTFAPILGTQ